MGITNEDNWGTVSEALDFYGLAPNTLHNWRRQGKIKSKEAYIGNKLAYSYYLDKELRDSLVVIRQFDKRWRQD